MKITKDTTDAEIIELAREDGYAILNYCNEREALRVAELKFRNCDSFEDCEHPKCVRLRKDLNEIFGGAK